MSSEDIRKGRRDDRVRNDLGNAIAIFSVIAAVPIGMAVTWPWAVGVMVGGCLLGVIIAYG